MTIEVKLGDIVRLRKAHPCGSYEWEVVRAGADIGPKCVKCQRRVTLERGTFEARGRNLSPKVTNYPASRPNKMRRDGLSSALKNRQLLNGGARRAGLPLLVLGR